MAYFALLWKARTIEKYRQNYENEKYNSIMAANTPIPEKSLSQRWRYYRSDTRKRISKIFKRLYPEGSSISHFLLYLKTDLTIPNFILKSILGFLGGIVLTYLCFLFLVFQLSISLFHATVVSFIIGVLLTLGLAFSNRIRCLVFLLIPQLFSRVGRYTLTCYALVLILTGPAKNTLKNSEILTESMACQQVQIKATVNQIRYSMRKPYNSMGNSINIIIHRLNNVRRQFKAILLKLNRLVISILEVIQSGFSWLNSLTEICNKKFGTPLERCKKVLNEGIAQCKKRQDQNSNWDCDVSDKANIICSNAKRYNVICVYVDYVDGSIIATIKKRLKNYSKRIRNMLYLQIHTHHSYSFSSNTSHSASQVAAGIVTEIRKRADPLLTWLSWSSCVTSLFLLLIIFRAKYYQHMFETRSRFDNRYITKEMRDLDLKRLRQGRDTVLPLNRRERIKYVTTTSFRLVTSEKVYMTRSAVFTAITTFKLLIHMVADYSLFWVLATIRHHGKLQTILPMEAPDSGVNISGTGKMAEIFQSLLNALKTPLEYQQANENCLPNPHPPDLQRYSQIGILIFLLWFFALFEPYGLRLRHVIMGHYRPERAKARAEWLYNHILRTRGGFMKFARRKLHRKYKYCTEEKYMFMKWLETRIPFWWLRSLLGINPKEPHCLLCGTEEHRNDANTRLQRCNSINCLGIYCTSCFVDIGQLCTVCLSPNDYGDLSDVSLEKGSSDESDEESDSKAGSTTQLLDKTTDDINDELLLIKEGKKSNMLQEKRQIFSSIQNEDSREFSENTPLLYDSGAVFNKQTYIVSYHIRKKVIIMHHKKYIKGNNSKAKINKTTGFNNENYFTCPNKRDKTLSITKQLQLPHYTILSLNFKLDKTSYNQRGMSQTILAHRRFLTSRSSSKILPMRLGQLSYYSIDINKNNISITRTFHTFNVSQRKVKDKYNITIKKRKRLTPKHNKKMFEDINLLHFGSEPSSHNDNVTKTRCNKFYKSYNEYSSTSNKHAVIRSAFNITSEENKQLDDQEYDKREIFNSNIENKHACYYVRKFLNLCSGYWHGIKENVTSCSDLINASTKINLKRDNVTKNYKRRKKSKSNSKATTKYRSYERNDDEETRKYRISAFLEEQDWIKRLERKRSKKIRNKRLKVMNEGSRLENLKENDVTETVKNTNFEYNNTVNENFNQNFGNLPKLEKCEVCQEHIPNSLIVNSRNEKTSADIMRRMSFYKSIGNDDFDILKNELNQEPNRNFPLSSNTGQTIPIMRKEDNLIQNANIKNLSKNALYLQETSNKRNNSDNLKSNDINMEIPAQSKETPNSRTKLLKNLKKVCSILFCKRDNESACYLCKKIFNKIIFDGRHTSNSRDVKSENKTIVPSPVAVQFCECLSEAGTKHQQPEEKPQRKLTQKTNITDAEVEAVPVICHCGTQYTTRSDNVKKDKKIIAKVQLEQKEKATKKEMAEDIEAQPSKFRTSNYEDSRPDERKEEISGTSFESSSQMCLLRKLAANENVWSEIYEYTSGISIKSDSLISSCINSNASITDNTVCSYVCIDKIHEKKFKKPKYAVVTKANQCTTTDRARLCDVSTIIDDWWSPIVERKKIGEVYFEKKAGDFELLNKNARNKRKSRAAATDGKFVTFTSKAQINPRGTDDILSASRYLLQSQKYYNELFNAKYNGSYMYPDDAVQNLERNHSPNDIHRARRSHRSKRLEECYPSRK